MLPGGAAGHAFFGEKGIEGQKSEWRFKKMRFLAEQGFELCGHTLWHANLGKYSDAVVQEQIARGTLAIDSAVPGYRVRTFALPLGVWPKNRALAVSGEWKNPHGGQDRALRLRRGARSVGRAGAQPVRSGVRSPSGSRESRCSRIRSSARSISWS